jgi:hypothetical protein
MTNAMMNSAVLEELPLSSFMMVQVPSLPSRPNTPAIHTHKGGYFYVALDPTLNILVTNLLDSGCYFYVALDLLDLGGYFYVALDPSLTDLLD